MFEENKKEENLEQGELQVIRYTDESGNVIERFGHFIKKEDGKTIDEAIEEKRELLFKKGKK